MCEAVFANLRSAKPPEASHIQLLTNPLSCCRDGKCQVKFGTGKSEVIQDAEFLDPNTLK